MSAFIPVAVHGHTHAAANALSTFCGLLLRFGANADAYFKPALATGILRRALAPGVFERERARFSQSSAPIARGYFPEDPCTEKDRPQQRIHISRYGDTHARPTASPLPETPDVCIFVQSSQEARVWLKNRAGVRASTQVCQPLVLLSPALNSPTPLTQ